MPRTQTNRSFRQLMEENRPKSDSPHPPSVEVEYQLKAEGVQGRTHALTDQARKLFITIPGTSTVDWQKTHAARSRFVSAQTPLVRR